MTASCEPDPILDKGWDVLIVLDACRYDSFKSVYRDFLDGRLEKKRGACSTVTWLNSIFSDSKYDITYVSANPYVNSRGVRRDAFDARGKFEKIYDVWDYGWSDERGTVLPGKVTETAERAHESLDSDRMIVHYMQPHKPFRCLENPSSNLSFLARFAKRHHLLKKIGMKIYNSIGKAPPSHLPFERYKEFSKEELLDFHKDNLRWVLSEVKELVDEIDEEVVITSDHGDSFGEGGEWFHRPTPTDNPAIREVPWLEVSEDMGKCVVCGGELPEDREKIHANCFLYSIDEISGSERDRLVKEEEMEDSNAR